MSLTTAGAIRLLLGAVTGIPFYRDGAPPTQLPPFGVVQEGIGLVPLRHGDFADTSATVTVTEEAQVDIFENARSGSPAGLVDAETYLLPDKVMATLYGAHLPPIGQVVPRSCRVMDARRWPVAGNVLRHTYTIQLTRDLRALGGTAPWSPATAPTAVQVFTQSSPAASWTFIHSLGRLPIVEVYVGGEEWNADVAATSTTVTVTFASPQSGTVVLT